MINQTHNIHELLRERTEELNQANDRLAKLTTALEQAYQDLGEAQRARLEEVEALRADLNTERLKFFEYINNAYEAQGNGSFMNTDVEFCRLAEVLGLANLAARKEAE